MAFGNARFVQKLAAGKNAGKLKVSLKYMWNELLILLFPEHCINCKKSGNTLCAICERTIITKPIALSGTTATLFDYKQPLVKKTIWALKYHHKRSLATYFGTALYREFFKQLTHGHKKLREEIILIPIPAHKKANAARGYNHTEAIARAIERCGKEDNLKLTVRNDVLIKKKENIRQVEAGGRAGRMKNVEDLFIVRHGEELTGKTVIIIDDVITTGATMADARRALREWKPKRILAIAVAH